MFKSIVAIVLILLAPVVVGCGKGDAGPKTHPVSGKVTLDGKPLADTNVEFLNKEAQFASFGKTDAQGSYRLVQGAPAGENSVVIRKPPPPGAASDHPEMDSGQIEAMYLGNEQFMRNPLLDKESGIPPEYSDPLKTPLKFMVPEGGTDGANFDL